ncbi:hypothetical protein NSTCB13_00576 [Nostoc sp. DSM 114160]
MNLFAVGINLTLFWYCRLKLLYTSEIMKAIAYEKIILIVRSLHHALIF